MRPVIALNKLCAIFQSYKLVDNHILHWRPVPHKLSNVLQSMHSVLHEALLDQSKAPVRAKPGVTQLEVKNVDIPPGTEL